MYQIQLLNTNVLGTMVQLQNRIHKNILLFKELICIFWNLIFMGMKTPLTLDLDMYLYEYTTYVCISKIKISKLGGCVWFNVHGKFSKYFVNRFWFFEFFIDQTSSPIDAL